MHVGTRLGPYEILSAIGAGGMGEVYRARDTRLGREVAIKILPAERLADEHRRRRFVKEAQALSALNHPHIVTIYEIESSGDIDFIVMELVRGTTLDLLIPKHGLRLNELLRIAIPAADAIAAAHARGIIHRDLKPANIIVGDDGTVKVLDFGLAKLVVPEERPARETMTDADIRLTAAGRIAGTPAYMSPEQATGGQLDARSDVFSFGAALYEMATGVRAFAGDTTADTLAAVLAAPPKPPTQIVTGLPREIERLILRCLRKDPERRYQSMLDVRNELQDIKEESDSPAAVAPGLVTRPRRVRIAAAIAAGMMVLAAASWLFLRPDDLRGRPTRVVPLTALEGFEMMPTLSPDGNQVAFAWNGDKQSGNIDIYVSMVGSTTVRRITSNPAIDFFPSWSPDGRHIAFIRQLTDHVGRVYLVSPLGGPERRLNDFDAQFDRAAAFGQLSWSPDGRSIMAARSSTRPAGESTGIYLLPLDGSEPRMVTPTKAPVSDRDPALSPDGGRLAYFSCGNCCWGDCDLMAMRLDGGLAAAAPPTRLTSMATQLEGVAWTRDSRSVLFGVVAGFFRYLWRVDIDGRTPPQRIESAALGARLPATVGSRDRVVFGRWTHDSDIYRVDLSGPPRAIGVSSFYDAWPTFSPDGRHVAFCSTRSGETMEIWMAAADGSGARQLTHDMGPSQCGPSWAPDERTIAFRSDDGKGRSHIWTIDVDGGNLRRITTGPDSQHWPSWSTDGAWIYFGTKGQGRTNISRISRAGGGTQKVIDGAFKGSETADGKYFVYTQAEDRAGSPVMLVPLHGGAPRRLVDCAYGFSVGPPGVSYYPCRSEGGPVSIAFERSLDVRVIDPSTRRDRRIATLPDVEYGGSFWGPRLSPDGNAILYGKLVNYGEDLMMIENFR
jgi:Tol biopolymer transport system component/tRNA A-37 threonylcarbamoyl transferase component Bud32